MIGVVGVFFLLVSGEWLGVGELQAWQLIPHKLAHQIAMGRSWEDSMGSQLLARWLGPLLLMRWLAWS